MNSRAYYLSPAEVDEFKVNPEIKRRLFLSLTRMLQFYGVEYEESAVKKKGRVVKRDDYEQRLRNMMVNSHNYLRITRIMTCFADVGMHQVTFAMAKFYFGEARRFPRSTLEAWKEIVERQGFFLLLSSSSLLSCNSFRFLLLGFS